MTTFNKVADLERQNAVMKSALEDIAKKSDAGDWCGPIARAALSELNNGTQKQDASAKDPYERKKTWKERLE